MAEIKVDIVVKDLEKLESLLAKLSSTIQSGSNVSGAVAEAEKIYEAKKKTVSLTAEERENNRLIARDLQLQAKINTSQVGTYNRMTAELNRLIFLNKDLNLKTKEGRQEWEKNLRQIEKYDTELKKLDAQMGRHQRNVGNYTAAVKKGFMQITMAVAGAVAIYRTLERTIGVAIKSYNAQIEAEKKLETVIKSTGGAAGVTSSEIKKLASDLQRTTIYGDEVTISMAAVLLTFTNIGKKAMPDAIKAVQNMSAALGTDLQSSAIQVGKALNDPIKGITALRRVGVSFTESQVKQIKQLVEQNRLFDAQTMILKELETEFGGMAEAMTQTTEGAVIQMKNAWGELLEALVKGAQSTGVITFLQNVADVLTNITDLINDENISGLRKFMNILVGDAGATLAAQKKYHESYLENEKELARSYVKIVDKRGNNSEVLLSAYLTHEAELIKKAKWQELKVFQEAYEAERKLQIENYGKKPPPRVITEDEKKKLEALKKANEAKKKAEKEYEKDRLVALTSLQEEEGFINAYGLEAWTEYLKNRKSESEKYWEYEERVLAEYAEFRKAAMESIYDEDQIIDLVGEERYTEYIKKRKSEGEGYFDWEKRMKGEQAEYEEKLNKQTIDNIYQAGDALSKLGGFEEEFALFQIGIKTAESIANGIALVSKSSESWYEAAAGYAVIIASILSFMASASSYLQSSPKFAEGEIDIHSKGEKPGQDSIMAQIMPGESVITTKATKKYKNALQDILSDKFDQNYIHINSVMPEMTRDIISRIENAKISEQRIVATLDDYEQRRKLERLIYVTEKNNQKLVNVLQANYRRR